MELPSETQHKHTIYWARIDYSEGGSSCVWVNASAKDRDYDLADYIETSYTDNVDFWANVEEDNPNRPSLKIRSYLDTEDFTAAIELYFKLAGDCESLDTWEEKLSFHEEQT